MKNATMLAALFVCASSSLPAQSPMIIINGMRYEKCETTTTSSGGAKVPFADLKDAIDNVEVVKGRAAIALYGAAAADGVITITLKKGAAVPANLCDSQRAPEPLYVIDGVVVSPLRGDPAPSARPPKDPIATFLYPPEMVMAHQAAIGLTESQRASIQGLVKQMQTNAVDTQFKLAAAGEKLARALAASSVDEATVLQQIDQVLAAEREVKRAQLTLLVRVKNQLTPAQQAALDKLK